MKIRLGRFQIDSILCKILLGELKVPNECFTLKDFLESYNKNSGKDLKKTYCREILSELVSQEILFSTGSYNSIFSLNKNYEKPLQLIKQALEVIEKK